MEAVFNRQMMLYSIRQSGSVSGETGDEESGFYGGLLAHTSFTLYADDAGEISPSIVVAEAFKCQRVTDRLVAADFNASAGFVGGLVKIHLHAGKLLLVAIGKTSRQCPV
jgi:hypothetical protein